MAPAMGLTTAPAVAGACGFAEDAAADVTGWEADVAEAGVAWLDSGAIDWYVLDSVKSSTVTS